MKARSTVVVVVAAFGLANASAAGAEIGTAVTYQGVLKDGGTSVTDDCDFEFTLWDDPAAGSQVGPTLTPTVTVIDGLFVVDLDFQPGAFTGDARWLEIAVCCPTACAPGYTLLTPRQELTPTPHALRAAEGVGPPNAVNVDTATARVGIGTDTPAYKLHVAANGERAVFGENTTPTGVVYGVYGTTESTGGKAVYGEATALTGSTNGGRFITASADGVGVLGMATNTDPGVSWGVLGMNAGSGRGVEGQATAPTGVTFGGRFQSDSDQGRGVFGKATAQTGVTYGGIFESASNEGRGVWAHATDTTGVNFGVSGQTDSPNGYAGYFTGGRNYFQGDVGIGTTNPLYPLHAVGDVTADGGSLRSINANNPSARVNLGWGLDAALNDVARIRIGGEGPGSDNGLDIQTVSDVSLVRILHNGNVGIGNDNPAFRLHVTTNGERAVFADNTAAVGPAYGVYGESDSDSGTGVYGRATALTGYTRGGYFQSDSTGGRGVYGWATAASGGTYGGFFESGSTGGTGVAGIANAQTGTNIGVYGHTASPSGFAGYFFGGKNFFQGNVGIGTTAPIAALHIIEPVLASGKAVIVEGGADGVNPNIQFKEDGGETANIILDEANANALALKTGGVQRMVIEQGGNVGIGTTSPSATLDVQGTAVVTNSSGLTRCTTYVSNDAGKLLTYGPNGALNVALTNGLDPDHGNMRVYDANNLPQAGMYVDGSGNGIVFGDTKSFRVPNPGDPETEIWYASIEGPEAAAYIRGTATLVNGRATITFPDHFVNVATSHGMTVQLTPLSADSKGLAVVRKGLDGVVVRELDRGRGSYDFDFVVMAVRKGHEDYRVIRPVTEARPAVSNPPAPVTQADPGDHQ